MISEAMAVVAMLGYCQAGRCFALVKVRGQRRYLGLDDTPARAHAGYVEAASKAYGEYARAG